MASLTGLPTVDPAATVSHSETPSTTDSPITIPIKAKHKAKATSSSKSVYKQLRSWWLSQKRNFRRRRDDLHQRCFWLTYLAHVCAYMLRKPLSLIKVDMAHVSGVSMPQMGWMDVALLLPLATIQLFAARLGQPYGPRKVIAASLLGAALFMSLFGYVSSYSVMLILLVGNGACQALLMPFCVTALSAWHSGSGQDLNFGIWGSSMFVGLTLSTACSHALRYILGWQHTFFLPALLAMATGGLIYRLLRMPSGTTASARHTSVLDTRSGYLRGQGFVGHDSISTDSESEQEMEVYVIESGHNSSVNKSIVEVMRLPYVPQLALAYMCINALRYALHMWLPLYFQQQLGYSRLGAGYFSTLYEVGGIVGSVTLGSLSDGLFGGRRVAACQVSLTVGIAAVVLLYITRHWGLFFNCLFLVLLGAGSGGTDVIISTSLAIDIGHKADCVSSVAGVIGGMGIFGAVLQGPLVAILARKYGSSGVLSFMTITALLSVLATARARGLDSQRSIDVARFERKAAQ
eukprot:TRINITY_DN12240_c2_g3_i3.p1 TRINITY_DN12240_c2_g3~~TRINITY_DN12240_c2_g3_i3.p1  ORF type:complete len:519 (+),score=51.88 TRINITY_DN12240_c2_g3_i3:87-1643(+)